MAERFRRQQTEESEEEHFGHILLQDSYYGDVFSLNLYQTGSAEGPGIAGKGSYLPPLVLYEEERYVYPIREALRSTPIGVELTADGEAFHRIRSLFEESESSSDSFTLTDPEENGAYGVRLNMSPPIRHPGRTVWSGTFFGEELGGSGTEFAFVLEQYGTIEPILLLMIIFLIISKIGSHERTAECYYQALRLCGEGNVKVYAPTWGIKGMVFSEHTGCHIECFEPRKPPSEEEGER